MKQINQALWNWTHVFSLPFCLSSVSSVSTPEVSPQNSSVTSMLKIVTQKLSVNAVSEKGAFLLIRTQNIQKKNNISYPLMQARTYGG